MQKGKGRSVSYLVIYYRKERTRIVKELGGKCAVCGRKGCLEIHHTTPTLTGRGRGMLNRLVDWKRNMDKLQLLCSFCHELEHHHN